MGRGVFGIEAAANLYFKKSSVNLRRDELIQLAASLPSPRKHNPLTQTKEFKSRVKKIKRNLRLGTKNRVVNTALENIPPKQNKTTNEETTNEETTNEETTNEETTNEETTNEETTNEETTNEETTNEETTNEETTNEEGKKQ